MRWIEFDVPIAPVGKGRPRMTKSGRAYTPSKTRTTESIIATTYLATRAAVRQHTGPVTLWVAAMHRVPASWSKSKRAAALDGRVPCMVKPDVDNTLKCVADALSGVAYLDDKQMVHAVAQKCYGPMNNLRIRIEFHEGEVSL